MSIESASLEQLKVHMQYMRDTVVKLHERLDELPTAKQVQALEERVEHLQAELHEQSKMMATFVNLERFAKWLGAFVALAASAYGLWRLISGKG